MATETTDISGKWNVLLVTGIPVVLHIIQVLIYISILAIFAICVTDPRSLEQFRSLSSDRDVDEIRQPRLESFFCSSVIALESANVTYWMLPHSGLTPSESSSTDYMFNQWQTGTKLGVLHDEVLPIQLAITALDEVRKEWSLGYVETYSGMRIFVDDAKEKGTVDNRRFDYSEPYVDLVYFRRENGQFISHCCDCEKIAVSSCTKKTCGCTTCAYDEATMLPFRSVRIWNVARNVALPCQFESINVALKTDGVHPVFMEESPVFKSENCRKHG